MWRSDDVSALFLVSGFEFQSGDCVSNAGDDLIKRHFAFHDGFGRQQVAHSVKSAFALTRLASRNP